MCWTHKKWTDRCEGWNTYFAGKDGANIMKQILWKDVDYFYYFLFFTRYLKAKINQSSGGANLPPLTTSNHVSSNQNENYKSNVPINATLIGGFITAVNMICGPLIFHYVGKKDSSGGPYSILVILSTIHLPLVLAFTIKYNKKNNKVAPNVPGTLQFHEDKDESHKENSESQNIPNFPEILQFYDDNEESLDENSEFQNISIAPGTFQFHEENEKGLDESSESQNIHLESQNFHHESPSSIGEQSQAIGNETMKVPRLK